MVKLIKDDGDRGNDGLKAIPEMAKDVSYICMHIARDSYSSGRL